MWLEKSYSTCKPSNLGFTTAVDYKDDRMPCIIFYRTLFNKDTSTSILKHLGNVDARIAYTQKFIQKSILMMILQNLLYPCHGLNPWVQSGVHINGSHFLMLVSLVCIVLALRLRPFLSFTPLTIVHEMCIKRATLYNRRGIVDRTHFIDASKNYHL